jgi:hypothetical protein
MSSSRLALAVAAALLPIALLACGCTKKTTAPLVAARVYRTVTATLSDSLGSPVVHQQVVMISFEGSAGTVPVLYQRTDDAGQAAFVLEAGSWAAAVEPLAVAGPPAPHLVAGGTFTVPVTRPAGEDTLVVRLRLGTASRVAGTTTLANQSDQGGTSISTSACLFPVATSDAMGGWTLQDMPPGTWSVVMSHGGYAQAVRTVTVPLPGSTVALAPVQLAGMAAQR